MNVIVYSRYGGPEVLRMEDIETPAPKDDEVRIRVRAAGVNPMDRHFMRGEPKAGRIVMGLLGGPVGRIFTTLAMPRCKMAMAPHAQRRPSRSARPHRARQRHAAHRPHLPTHGSAAGHRVPRRGARRGKVVIRI